MIAAWRGDVPVGEGPLEVEAEKTQSRERVERLVAAFQANQAGYLRADYNETQARTDFISPLLSALGWDVPNERQLPRSLREVIEEANVTIEDDARARRPDYELKLGRERKLFVEAKKPAVNIEADASAAFQARRYGYSASMPIVVLTNFRQIAVYDCTIPPDPEDGSQVARIALMTCDDFIGRFDEFWDYLSREVIYSGRFDERYEEALEYRGQAAFDELFLRQVKRWRELLAVEIHRNSPVLNPHQLTYAVHLFLARLIFLRICEDRDLEDYEQLQAIAEQGGYAPYLELLARADAFYDSSLFDQRIDEGLDTVVGDETLVAIIRELYYPESPYTFAVVEAEVLGHIYEQFLGEVVEVAGGHINVVQRPEVRASGGVVATPRFIVDEIVARCLAPSLDGRPPEELGELTILDPCCGSGVFLLSAFEQLCDYYLEYYASEPDRWVGRTIEPIGERGFKLLYEERRRILLDHIRGVDIDADAVEVAQLSLLVKLIEDVSRQELQDYVNQSGELALPSLAGVLCGGNSLVGRREWEAVIGPLDAAVEASVVPMDWNEEFPIEMEAGGFSVIIGNPPYIRIQNMAQYSPNEVAYYEKRSSPYATAHQDGFDKYALFIERALQLLAPEGRLGVVVPHKFMTTKAGRPVRELLVNRLSEVVHFGSKPVFPGVANYTALLFAGPTTESPLLVERVTSVDDWRFGRRHEPEELPRAGLGVDRWNFANAEFLDLIAGVREAHGQTLDDVAEIFVGLQTSADDVYSIHGLAVDEDSVTIEYDGHEWSIEREVLRPFLHDVVIERYVQPIANRWLIFPYRIEDGVAHLIQPDEMQERFPGCWAYLQQRREELEGRNVTGGLAAERQWYQFGRSQSLTKFQGEKIILPILSLEPRYTLDAENIHVTGGGNGPYYLIRSTDERVPHELLLAVLNHPLAEAHVRSGTSVFRGGYYSHGKQFIADIPIPRLDERRTQEIVDAVKELSDLLHLRSDAKTPHERQRSGRRIRAVEDAVGKLVDRAFRLGDDDHRVIDSVPMP